MYAFTICGRMKQRVQKYATDDKQRHLLLKHRATNLASFFAISQMRLPMARKSRAAKHAIV